MKFNKILAALCLFAGIIAPTAPALAAYAFVSGAKTAAATISITISSGQSVIVYGINGTSGAATMTLADGTNTYTKRATANDTFNGETYSLFDSLNPTPGTYTLTLTGGGAGTSSGIIYLLYTGLASYDNSATLWAHAGWSTSTNGIVTPSITPVSQPGMLIGFASGSGSTITVGTVPSFNGRTISGSIPNANSLGIEDIAYAATSATNAVWTFASATDSNAIITATYLISGGATCTHNFWSSTGAWAIPNGTTGSYWKTNGTFATPDCSTGSYWLKSGAVGAN